ncbi:MAG: hypothetical protein K0R65_2625 [Crocinitomicaceae bacterium]|jgi:hypothetical protein|nr:hypothetical protein [Crocinitomicaceae bacterium]
MQTIESIQLKDKKIGFISSSAFLLLLCLGLYIYTLKPYREPKEVVQAEVFMEIPLEAYHEIPPRGSKVGGGGGGTPSNDPVDNPKPQTEKIITNSNGEVKTHSGQSNNQNANNSQNTSTSTQKAENPFGDGGDGGGKGGGRGKGTGFGRDEGTGSGSGGGDGDASKPRVRLNDPNNDNISSSQSCKVCLKLSINAQGDVVRAENLTSKTTTTNQTVINQVISNVKNQVRYNKKEGASLEQVYLTVNISAK